MKLKELAAGFTALILVTCFQPAHGQESSDAHLMSYDILLQRINQLESQSQVQTYDSGTAAQINSLESQVAAQASALQELRRELKDSSAGTSGHGMFMKYESLLLKPTQSNSTAFIASNPDSYDHVRFDWDIEHSPRVELGYMAGSDNLGWRARYWHFRHHNQFFANAANGLIPTDEGIVGFFSEDGDIVTGISDVDTGTFTSAIQADVVDLELERAVGKGVSYLAGMRYGQIRQKYIADTDEGIAQSGAQFHGVGPTAALNLKHAVTNQFSLFGGVRGSLLYGKQSFSAWDNIANGSSSRINASNEDAFATNAELQLGMLYQPSSSLSFHLAVEAQHWGDVGGANPTAFYVGSDNSVDSDSPSDDDLSLIGLNIGAALHW